MKIYIRVDETGFGDSAWLYHDEDQSFLMDPNCPAHLEPEVDLIPAKTVKEAKRWMKEAKQLMEHDGAAGKVRASAWRYVNEKLVETKFTKDNKIKR